MASIALEDIEEIARVESAKMQHFYIGVEHLFIALTKLDGGLTPDLLGQASQSARYLRYATRELAGQGDNHRYWPGYRTSPRAVKVLARARNLIADGIQPAERALLMAIVEEGDSIPMRVLRESDMDTTGLLEMLRNWSGLISAQPPAAIIEGGDNFTDEQRGILQQMFRKYERVIIEHIFSEGYSGSKVLLVRPQHADGRTDVRVVVKLDDRQAIQWEKKRYDSFVRDTLPLGSARIEAEPVLSDRLPLGGLKYTFVRIRDEMIPTNLREFAASHDAAEVADFLREGLYESFRETWWGQAQPYNFVTWQEYELLLPPALIVKAVPNESLPATGRVLRPLGEWSRDGTLHPGEIVNLDSFTALKVKRDKGVLQLAAGAGPEAVNWASRIEIQDLDLSQKSYFRGELVPEFVVRIVQTRDDILQQQAQMLEPDFNIMDETLPGGSLDRLPNPLYGYVRLLDRRISGSLSTIHGDLHTGNVLIGLGRGAGLIDFEWTRDGHTLLDWAVLEISLLIDYVTTFLGSTWDEVRQAVAILDTLNRDGYVQVQNPLPLARAFLPIAEIRHIVAELLANRSNWTEYYTALSLCALRVIGWSNRPLNARRLAFLVSALALQASQRSDGLLTDPHTDVSDLTTDQGSLA